MDDPLGDLSRAGPKAWAAIRTLGQRGDDRSLVLLGDYASSPDWRFRRAAIEAISMHRLASNRADQIRAALGDPSPYVVRTACDAVARLQDRGARLRIVALAKNSDASTRAAAIRAWKCLWQAEDFGLVLAIHLNDKAEDVRKEAAWLLREHVDKPHWRQLFDVWSIALLARYRSWACDLAGRFGPSVVDDALKRLTEDRDGHVRKAAAKARDGAA